MKFKMCFLLLIIIVGCSEAKPSKPTPVPQPEILVISKESTENNVSVTVKYFNHLYGDDCHCFVTISNHEQLDDYKRKIEFLLNQLEQIDKRMQINESVDTSTK